MCKKRGERRIGEKQKGQKNRPKRETDKASKKKKKAGATILEGEKIEDGAQNPPILGLDWNSTSHPLHIMRRNV